MEIIIAVIAKRCKHNCDCLYTCGYVANSASALARPDFIDPRTYHVWITLISGFACLLNNTETNVNPITISVCIRFIAQWSYEYNDVMSDEVYPSTPVPRLKIYCPCFSPFLR